MRLIDADKLKYYGNHIGDEYEDRFHDFQYVDRDQIDKAPSIDIVRCKECKWYGNEQKKIYECCTYWAQNGGVLVPMKPDDYCSYGEREGE